MKPGNMEMKKRRKIIEIKKGKRGRNQEKDGEMELGEGIGGRDEGREEIKA